MKIVLCAATNLELDAVKKVLNSTVLNNHQIDLLYRVTGIGSMHSAYHFSQIFAEKSLVLVMQVGIAGSFDPGITIGSTCVIANDRPGDLGVVEEGKFKDVFEMNLMTSDDYPYSEGKLQNKWLTLFDLTKVNLVDAITVSTITTDKIRIEQLRRKYNCTTESMEGAALHYAGLQNETPFLQVRTISNYVGERDKKKWNIPLALDKLGESVNDLLNEIQESQRLF